MNYRRFGRLNWKVSEIGYGMWGLAGWKGHDDKEMLEALELSVELGCNFYDTAWGYGEGESERILGRLLKKFSDKKLYVASKIPPKNFKWPSKSNYLLKECFPASHIREYTEKSLKNLNVECIDLMQFHVWEDGWADNEEWQREVDNLKKEGKITSMGISVNRWEPTNCINTLKTNHIDSVQVIYNIFDQAPEDTLFPICKDLDIAVIARVPFDEGTLTGMLTKETTFPAGDWRATYFVPENLIPSVERAEKLKPLVPTGSTLPDMALRFILENKQVSTIIPGMRSKKHVTSNLGVSDKEHLEVKLLAALKGHRWDRNPTTWSQ